MRKCSKGLANEFLYHTFKKCICDAESYRLSYIPEHTGIIKFNNRYQYYRYMKLPDKVEKCVSENYKSKCLPYTELSAADISDCLNPFVNGHEMMFLLITFSLMGMLSSVIEKTFHIQNVLLIISTYENSMAKKLCSCILRTFNKDKPPVSLTLSKKELTRLQSNSSDEVMVYDDNTTFESKVKRENSLDVILNYASSEQYKPHMDVIFSDTIQHVIPNCKQIHFDINKNFAEEFDLDRLTDFKNVLNHMSAYFIDSFCEYYDSSIDRLRRNYENIQCVLQKKDKIKDKTLIPLCSIAGAVLNLWCSMFNIGYNYKNIIDILIDAINSEYNISKGNSAVITEEFFRTLNSAAKNGILTFTELTRDMNYKENSFIVVHDDDLLYIDENTISSIILPCVKNASTVQGIADALKAEGLLVATKKNRKPVTLYDGEGNGRIYSMFAFKFREMASSELVEHIDTLNFSDFFCDDNSEETVIPVISNNSGLTAGQVFDDSVAENFSRFVTGKSGSGKSVFLMSLVYHLNAVKNRIVIFDSNCSFSNDELLKVLPEQFVNTNISRYSIENNGIPVNPFAYYENDSGRNYRNQLTDIFTSCMHNLSEPQIIATKEIVKNILKNNGICNLNFGNINDIVNLLKQNEDKSVESISKRLVSVFDDYADDFTDTSTFQFNSWSELFDHSKDIVIIEAADSIGQSGNMLLDILMTSLYIYQKHNIDKKQLSIIIDEVQNQNLSTTGPISKIFKEGRKHHIDLNCATQFLPGSIEDKKILKQAGMSVFFKLDDTSLNEAVKELGLKGYLANKFKNLNSGECFIKGALYNKKNHCNETVTVYGKTSLPKGSPLLK